MRWGFPNSCHSQWLTILPLTQSVLRGLRRPRSRSLRALATYSRTVPKMWQWPSVPKSPRLIQHSTYLVKSLKSSWEKHKTRLDFFIRNILVAYRPITCFDWLIDVLFLHAFVVRLSTTNYALFGARQHFCVFLCLTFLTSFIWKGWEAVHFCCISKLM